ncbi:MAG: hypothetical protein WCI18_03005 [Pseudomonadota bacterium]
MKRVCFTILMGIVLSACNSPLHKGEGASSSQALADESQQKGGFRETDSTERDIYFVLSANYNPYGNTIVYKGDSALASITTLHGREERDVRQSSPKYIILRKFGEKWVIQKEALTAITMEDMTECNISASDAKYLLSALEKELKQAN